jgi:hypothetical protein
MTTRLVTIGVFAVCLCSLVAFGLLSRIRPTWVSDPRTLFARLMARRPPGRGDPGLGVDRLALLGDRSQVTPDTGAVVGRWVRRRTTVGTRRG